MYFEASAEIRLWTTTAAQMRDEYIQVGFTREEALDLIKVHILAGSSNGS